MASPESQPQPQPQPWYTAFPAPRTTSPHAVSREELLRRFKDGQKGGTDFLVVDLRRDDYQVSSATKGTWPPVLWWGAFVSVVGLSETGRRETKGGDSGGGGNEGSIGVNRKRKALDI